MIKYIKRKLVVMACVFIAKNYKLMLGTNSRFASLHIENGNKESTVVVLPYGVEEKSEITLKFGTRTT